MQTPLEEGAKGLAQIVVKHWHAALGLVGLLIFAASLVSNLPGDIAAIRCTALIMFGWGFGQTECRTFRKSVIGPYQITRPHWRLTVSGALLFTIAIGAAIVLARHLWFVA